MNKIAVGDAADIFNGKTPAKADQRPCGRPVLKIKDVRANGLFVGRFTSFVDPDFAEKHNAKVVRRNDVLVLNAAHNAEYVGSKQYRAEPAVEGSLATGEWLIARSNSNQLKQSYLWYWFQSPQTRFKIRQIVKGIHLYPKDVAALPIPLPPTEEQRRIATILDKAEAIRRKREQALALADDFLRSAFLEMFGDPAFNPKEYDVKPVGDLLSSTRAGTQSGPFGSALKKHEYVGDGVPVWGIDNVQPNRFVLGTSMFITEEKYRQLERYSVQDGDILISRAGTVGRMCIAYPDTPKSIISTNLVRVSLDSEKLLPEHFVSLFTYFPHRLGGLKTNQKENAFTFLNPKTLKALKIPVPPVDAQMRFAEIVKKRDGLLSRIEQDIRTSKLLSASLCQRAFRGEL